MNWVDCIICSSKDHREISTQGRGIKIRTVICTTCGLVFTNPRLDYEENSLFYKTFHKILYHGFPKPTEQYFENQRHKGRSIQKYFAEHEYSLNPALSVLDVGCGAGGILDCFRSLGYKDLKGLEPSEEYVKFGQNEGLDIECGELETFDCKRPFDVIIMRDVVEHLLRPDKALQKIRRMCHRDTLVFIETNNVYKSLHPTELYSYQFHLAHPYIFSPTSLRNLLKKSGFGMKNLVTDRYMRCIAKLDETEAQNDIEHEDYHRPLRAIRNHDKFLFLNKRIYSLRKAFSRFRKAIKMGLSNFLQNIQKRN